jgi:restriction system protein
MTPAVHCQAVDGLRLFGMIKQARASLAAVPSTAPQPARDAAEPAAQISLCPTCGSEIARKGGNAGSQFWRCTNTQLARELALSRD